MAICGYTEDIAESMTRSAHRPAGKDAFSWFDPVTTSLLTSRAAAPTWNFEYGA